MLELPHEIIREVETSLCLKISHYSAVGGGCINHAGALQTSKGTLFIKWNDADTFPGMLDTEVKGLELLRKTGSVRIPAVLFGGVTSSHQFLVLEFVQSGNKHPDYWKIFGEQLALLHQFKNQISGLEHDNYIGSLRQSNRQHISWPEFFIEQRLKPQLDAARGRSLIDAGLSKKFSTLFKEIPSILPEEAPSLLHGDLWGGNLMTDSSGFPVLIDPSVYFGHREVDLAMTTLFGNFDRAYMKRYHEVYPLLAGVEERMHIYNLYPLLVHVNLFGPGYLDQVSGIMRRFT